MSDGPDGTLAICFVNVMVKQTEYRLEDKSANDDDADNRVTVTRLELQVNEVSEIITARCLPDGGCVPANRDRLQCTRQGQVLPLLVCMQRPGSQHAPIQGHGRKVCVR